MDTRDLVAEMDEFGRFSFDPRNGPDDIRPRVLGPLYPLAAADSDRFVRHLAEAGVPAGGWAVYGAAHAVTELLGGDFQHPVSDDLMDRSLQFLRSRGVPHNRLTGPEHQFWLAHRGRTEPWLTGRPKPSPSEAPVRLYMPGEERCIVQAHPQRDSDLIVVRRDPGAYKALIDARRGADDPRRSRTEWKAAGTLDELYWSVGVAFQTPTHWYDPDMGPYFPLPAPQLD